MQVKFASLMEFRRSSRDAGRLYVRILIEASRAGFAAFRLAAIRLRLFFWARRTHHNSMLSKFGIVHGLLYAPVFANRSRLCRDIEGLHCVVLVRHYSLVCAAFASAAGCKTAAHYHPLNGPFVDFEPARNVQKGRHGRGQEEQSRFTRSGTLHFGDS
jgi:hypothetical protein